MSVFKNIKASYQRQRCRAGSIKPLPVIVGIIITIAIYILISILIMPFFAGKYPGTTSFVTDIIALFALILGGTTTGLMIESKGALHGMLVGFGIAIIQTIFMLILIAIGRISPSPWYIIHTVVLTSALAILGGIAGGFCGNRLRNHFRRSTT